MYAAQTVARLTDELPNLADYNSGVGDIVLMTRVHSLMEDRVLCIGGLPTAKTFAASQATC